MGYENRLYIVEPYDGQKGCSRVIGMINLSKLSYESNYSKLVEEANNTGLWIYGDDGNTIITEDKYEAALKVLNLKDVINALTDDLNNTNKRILPTLNFLKSFLEWGNIKVLHYGY